MARTLLTLFSLVSLAIGVAGFAIAAREYEARFTQAADCEASQLDTLTAIVFDTDSRPHDKSQATAIARELLALTTLTAGDMFYAMSDNARRRVILDAKRASSKTTKRTAEDSLFMSEADRTRACLLSSDAPRSCLP